MIFTDRLFLSRLSPELMNAAMGGGLTVFMMISFFIGLIGYSTALVAQYYGAGQKEKCAVVTAQAIRISLVVAVPLILFCHPLAQWLFAWMSVPQAQLAPQMIYFDILLWSVGFSLLRASLSGFFSGIGRTGVVMLSSITALVLNTVLNYVLIFGKCGFPAMGIQGAAIATLVSGFLGLVILLVAFFRHKIRTEFSFSKAFHFDAAIFRKLLYFGSPAGLELFLNILAFNLVVMIFHSRGDVAATAATIMFNWDLVSFVPLIGLEIAVTSLVGRAMGAGRPDDAHSSVISGLKVGAFYSFWILAAFLFLPGVLVGMFHPVVPQDVFSQAEPIAIFMVRIAAIYVLIEAIYVVLIGALRGAGDTYWAMAISVGLHWMLVGATWLALRTFSLSVELAWTCVVVLFFLSAGVLYWRYQGGAWRSIRVVEQE